MYIVHLGIQSFDGSKVGCCFCIQLMANGSVLSPLLLCICRQLVKDLCTCAIKSDDQIKWREELAVLSLMEEPHPIPLVLRLVLILSEGRGHVPYTGGGVGHSGIGVLEAVLDLES